MKKLQNKVFLTIFLILTFFIMMYFILSNYRSYSMYKNSVQRSMDGVVRMVNMDQKQSNMPFPGGDFENRFFSEYDIYTFYLDSNNEYYKIVDHSDSNNLDKVRNYADFILKSKKETKTKISNLYFGKYSYTYSKDNFLVVIDNTTAHNEVIKVLVASLCMVVLLEVLIIYVSKKLTNWITKPAIDSYESQKSFVADASHELKTPIAIIMASADEIKENKDNKEYLNNIKEETDKMNLLVTNLLTLSKLDSSNEKILEEIDLSKLINKTCLKFESIAFEKNVKIKADIDENVKYQCNNLEINQLITILLDNAVEHSFEKTNINVNLKSDKKEILLEVINEGNTIPSEEIDKIFDRFYRSDKSRNRENNHYGLGLAIAKSIVKRHSGEILVSSENNITKFIVNLKK